MLSKQIACLLVVISFALLSCKNKKQPQPQPEPAPQAPTVSTSPVILMSESSAIGGAAIVSSGSDIQAAGICWDTLPGPNITKGKTVQVSGSNNFTCNITGLGTYKKYYVRAFATNSTGTGYGNEISFTSMDTWHKATLPGVSGGYINVIKNKGNRLYVGSGTGILCSADAGETWFNSGFTSTAVTAIGIGDNVVYAAQLNTIYRSINEGVSWTKAATLTPTTVIYDILVKGDDIYACGYEGVYLSTDNGDSWKSIWDKTVTTTFFKLNANSSAIFANNQGDCLHKTTDRGFTWTCTAPNLPIGSVILDFACPGSHLFCSSSTGVYFSADNGYSWSKRSDLPSEASFFSVSDSVVFIGTIGGKCLVSYNNGTNWYNITSTGLTPPRATNVVVTDKAFFAWHSSSSNQTLNRFRR